MASLISLHPYTPTGPRGDREALLADPVVRSLLRERATDQAVRIRSSIEERGGALRALAGPAARDPLAPVLSSLDRATDGLGSRRVANMLRAYVDFLQDPEYFGEPWPSDSEGRSLLDPILVETPASATPPDTRLTYLTSPALLVLQAIVYSHAEWFRPRHNEAYSALLAYSVLGHELDPPLVERDRRFVAALIAHQTLLRVSWVLDRGAASREVAVFYKDKLHSHYGPSNCDEDELIARALGNTLFSFLPETQSDGKLRRQLAKALVLTSLCLQCRHLRSRDPKLDNVRKDILGYAELLCGAVNDEEKRPYFVFCQFGRHVMQREAEQWDEKFHSPVLEKHVQEINNRENGVSLTVCFDRNGQHIEVPRLPPKKFDFNLQMNLSQEEKKSSNVSRRPWVGRSGSDRR